MANFTKLSQLCRNHGRFLLSKINSSIIVADNVNSRIRMISVTSHPQDLMEFFDDKKNWGVTEVKSGRSWKKDELRIKSNTDLHKLWYVLLKERNMLLTMEEECKQLMRLFPNPERLDKVEESMENLEEVVRERNRAYHELETGKTGEQTKETIIGVLGIPEEYKMTEHSIPKEVNAEWHKRQEIKSDPRNVAEFVKKYKEKEFLEKRREKTRNFNHVIGLLNRFPKMDMEALKEQYPDVDIEKAKASRKYKPPPVFD